MEKYLDQAIEQLTRLRIAAVKKGNNELEQSLSNVEMLIFKAYDHKPAAVLPELGLFKARREKLKLSLRQVAAKVKVSAATISRIETGSDAEYSTVKLLHEWYLKNGV